MPAHKGRRRLPKIVFVEEPLEEEEKQKQEEEEEEESSGRAPGAEEREKANEGRGHPGVNILVTGTPGTGKSTLCQLVSSAAVEGGLARLEHVDLGKLVREKGLHDGYNAEFDCFMLNPDKVCDELEERMDAGGVVLEAHSCDFFPERWFDLVVVLRTNNTVLYDRLEARKYKQAKVAENVEAEIMQVVLDEVRSSYRDDITMVLTNDTLEQLQDNCQRVLAWVSDWIKSHPL